MPKTCGPSSGNERPGNACVGAAGTQAGLGSRGWAMCFASLWPLPLGSGSLLLGQSLPRRSLPQVPPSFLLKSGPAVDYRGEGQLRGSDKGWHWGALSNGMSAPPHFPTASPGSPLLGSAAPLLCALRLYGLTGGDAVELGWPGRASGPGSWPCPEGETVSLFDAFCIWFLFCLGHLLAHAGP